MSNVQIDPRTGLPVPPVPTPQAAGTAPVQPAITGVPQNFIQQREHYIFTLPDNVLPEAWKTSGFSDTDRTFALTLLSTAEEEAALRTAGQNNDMSAVGKHWMLSSIYAIGGRYTGRNFDTITSWLDAIGPKGRKLVDHAWSHLHTISQKQGEDFLASMRRAD